MWFRSLLILLHTSRVILWKVDHFAAKISGDENVAKEISNIYGIHYIGEVIPGSNYYHFRILRIHPGLRYVFSTNMFLDDRVHNVLPQIGRIRELRNEYPIKLGSFQESHKFCPRVMGCSLADISFNDPYFPYQWYLDKKWMNVFPAWSKGLKGYGITTVILDDGLYFENPDINPNYDAEVSYDVTGTWISNDPTPDIEDYVHNSHGTKCAAIISAAANNSYCGVGIAFKAKVGGVRLLKGTKSHIVDAQEALALQVAVTKGVDIIVSSWGPPDNGKSIGGPEELAMQAIIEGIKKGRKGKGAIFLWAVGNGGVVDNCNLDGYASSIYTIAISSLTKSGYPCEYDEPCSATLASCFVGGKEAHSRSHMHTDNLVVPELDGGCKNSFQGTSAAAPLAAGVVALMLQANGNLTWRDVQHIIVRSARKPPNGYGWLINGAGLYFHKYSGFGAIDTLEAVELSSKWVNVPSQRNFTAHISGLPRHLLPRNKSCLRVLVPPKENFEEFNLEHTILTVSLNSTTRGKIELTLISPSGTISHLLTERPFDDETSGFKDWSFMSTHFWLEDPTGIWKVIVNNLSENYGVIKNAKLLFYGYSINYN